MANNTSKMQAAQTAAREAEEQASWASSPWGLILNTIAGLPQAAKTVTSTVSKTAKNVLLETPAREGAGAVLEFTNRNYFIPTTPLEKFVMGTDVVKPLSSQGSETLQTFGVSKENAQKYGLIAGAAMLGLDALPTSGAKKAVPAIAKGTKALDTATDVAKTTAKVTDAVKPIERGFAVTVKNLDKTTDALKAGIKSLYTPITNASTLAQANKLIAENIDEAITLAKSPAKATALSNTVAMRLIDDFQNAGRFSDAIDIVETTARKATNQGQAIQALSMYSKLTPAGALKYTQRIIDTANTNRKTAFKLTTQAAKEITRQAKRVAGTVDGSRERIIETAKLMQKMTDQVPATIWSKISSIQTMAQLLNPKTAIRNVVGNAAFGAIENIKDVGATGLDSALSLVTKQRTKSLPNIGKQLKGFKTGWTEGVYDALSRIDTSSIPTQFDLPKTAVFQGKIGSMAEKLLNLELKATDRAFYKAAYDGSLAEQLRAAKTSTITEAMKEAAHYDGLYKTFQDDNVVSKLFVGLKRAMNTVGNKEFGLGDFLLKYPKTPANLIARGIDYSPAGFTNSILQAAKPLVGKTFDQRKFVESFARAFTGTTALVGSGALMHRLGIITGAPEKDKDVRGVQRIAGLGGYKINTSALKRFVMTGFNPEAAKLQQGDTLINYDWMQPMAIGLSMGANIDAGNGTEGTMVDLLSSLEEGVNTIGEQPLMSGLSRLFRSGDFATSAKETLKQIPASFLPTFISQVNQLIDNQQRNAYDPNVWQYALNNMRYKVPGLAQTLPPMVSVYGEDLERYQGGSNNLFNVLFNPAFVSQAKLEPETKMLLDIMNSTGETTQMPRVTAYKIKVNGENKTLTANQITQYQRYSGTVTREIFASLAADENFQGLEDTEKVKYLSNLLTDINAAAKIVILGDRPQKPGKKTLQILQMFNGNNK